VIPLYTPECRSANLPVEEDELVYGHPRTQGKGVMPDARGRFSIGGKMVHHYMGCSTFSNYTVLPENRGRQDP